MQRTSFFGGGGMCEIWRKSKSDNYFKQKQGKNSFAGAGLCRGHLIHRMRSSKMGILKFLGCCGVRHRSRWVRFFCQNAHGVCQADRQFNLGMFRANEQNRNLRGFLWLFILSLKQNNLPRLFVLKCTQGSFVYLGIRTKHNSGFGFDSGVYYN